MGDLVFMRCVERFQESCRPYLEIREPPCCVAAARNPDLVIGSTRKSGTTIVECVCPAISLTRRNGETPATKGRVTRDLMVLQTASVPVRVSTATNTGTISAMIRSASWDPPDGAPTATKHAYCLTRSCLLLPFLPSLSILAPPLGSSQPNTPGVRADVIGRGGEALGAAGTTRLLDKECEQLPNSFGAKSVAPKP